MKNIQDLLDSIRNRKSPKKRFISTAKFKPCKDFTKVSLMLNNVNFYLDPLDTSGNGGYLYVNGETGEVEKREGTNTGDVDITGKRDKTDNDYTGERLTNIADGIEDQDAVSIAQVKLMDTNKRDKTDNDYTDQKLINLANGVADQDAVTIAQLKLVNDKIDASNGSLEGNVVIVGKFPEIENPNETAPEGLTPLEGNVITTKDDNVWLYVNSKWVPLTVAKTSETEDMIIDKLVSFYPKDTYSDISITTDIFDASDKFIRTDNITISIESFTETFTYNAGNITYILKIIGTLLYVGCIDTTLKTPYILKNLRVIQRMSIVSPAYIKHTAQISIQSAMLPKYIKTSTLELTGVAIKSLTMKHTSAMISGLYTSPVQTPSSPYVEIIGTGGAALDIARIPRNFVAIDNVEIEYTHKEGNTFNSMNIGQYLYGDGLVTHTLSGIPTPVNVPITSTSGNKAFDTTGLTGMGYFTVEFIARSTTKTSGTINIFPDGQVRDNINDLLSCSVYYEANSQISFKLFSDILEPSKTTYYFMSDTGVDYSTVKIRFFPIGQSLGSTYI